MNTCETIGLDHAINTAERLIAENRDHDEAELEYLEVTAATRPARDQPGTLGQQLHAVDVYTRLPFDVRRHNRDAAWQAVLDRVLPHRRPLPEQVRAYFGSDPEGRRDDQADGDRSSGTEGLDDSQDTPPPAIALAPRQAVQARLRKRRRRT